MRRAPSSPQQIAYVVPRLDAAVEHWIRVMGVGPFFVYDHVDYGGMIHRGRPTDVNASVAISWWGSIQIELIAQHNAAPSIYREFIERNGRGIHHVATYVDDYDAELEHFAKLGYPPVQMGGHGIGVRFCYLEMESPHASILELIEHTPTMRELNARMQAAARDWDGLREPVRRITQ